MPPLQAPYNNQIESPEAQFRAVMIQNGLTPPPTMELDGTLRRYGNPDNYWYIGWGDSIPSGKAGDWKTGAEITWTGNVGRPLSAAEMMQNTVRMAEAKKRHEEEKAKKNRDAAYQVCQIWENAGEASPEHPYLKTKGVQPHGARIGADGRLILPLFNQSGDLSSLQYIDALGGKLYHTGGATKGCYNLLGEIKDKVFISEGFATGATIHELTGDSVVVSYSAGSLVDVTGFIRKEFPTVRIIIFADNDKSGTGQKYADQAAAKHGAEVIMTPEEGDANDYVKAGGDLLGLLSPVSNVKEKLKLQWASDIPNEFTPPDEVIEGLFILKTCSVLYGDSNSGKTFFALSLAAAVASGSNIYDRRVDQGKVIYLATEAPGSIRTRLQAIKKKTGQDLSDLAIIPVPLNFYSNAHDIADVLSLVEELGDVKLIIGDTLARMSAGANENSGEDMGPVMERFSQLAEGSGAAVLIIHHNGKDAAKGSRGWSGIRAHIDTEIEVVESGGGRTATITKQRELGSKGEEINFDLEIMEMGTGKFGNTITTCIAIPSGSGASKKIDKKLSEKTKWVKDAWYDSGKEILEGFPYITRAGLIHYLVDRQDMDHGPAAQRVKASDPQFAGYLIQNGIIEKKKDGFIVSDIDVKNTMLISVQTY